MPNYSNGHRTEILSPSSDGHTNGIRKSDAIWTPRGEVSINGHSKFERISTPEIFLPSGVVVVGAHQDDLEEFAGSTARMLLMLGIPVHFAIPTDGREGTGPYTERYNISKARLVEIRNEEQDKAAAVISQGLPLQVVVHRPEHLLPDGRLPDYFEQTRDFINNVVTKTKSNVIIAHHSNDYHPDHNIVGNAAQQVAEDLGLLKLSMDKQFGKNWKYPKNSELDHLTGKFINPGFTLDKHFEETVEDGWYQPDFAVEVTPEIMAIKMKAIGTHVSQMFGTDFIERILESNRHRGHQAGVAYAEVFNIDDTGINVSKDIIASMLHKNNVYRRKKIFQDALRTDAGRRVVLAR